MTDKPHSVVRDVLSRLRRAERSLLRRGKAGGSRWLRRDLIFPTGREEICRGLAVGMFWACAPMPMQMVPALLFCWLARANIVLAMVCVWISNPFTYAPIFYLEYSIGRLLFGGGAAFGFADFKLLWDGGVMFDKVFDNVFAGILKPLLQGALVLGIAMAVAGYVGGFVVHHFLQKHERR